jgi:hypothetical protein
MHIGPLGVFRNLCSGVILDMVQRGELRNVDTNTSLRQLWTEFRSWCKSHRIPPPQGTLSLRLLGVSESKSDPPELHSCIKATTVKLLVAFLSYKLCAGCPSEPYYQTRCACVWAASEFMWTCDNAGLLLSEVQTNRLEYLGKLHVLCFMELYMLTSGRNLFSVKPKLHYFEELILQTIELRLNPKCLACWGEESLLGKLKRVGQRCHGSTMLRTSMQRWFVLLALRWEKRRQSGRWYLG